MKTANVEIVDVVPVKAGEVDFSKAPDVSWERARQLWQAASKGADAIIELGYVLAGLREQFFSKGGRPKTRPGADEFPGNGESGWQKTVQERLGITKQTAMRLIEKADALDRLTMLERGEEVTWKDAKGEVRVTQPTPEAQELARQVIPDVVAGLMNGRRAWAGVSGEGARASMGKQRSEVDHAGVMLRAIRSVRAALKQWDRLDPQDRAEVELAWADLLVQVPSTWAGARKGH